MVVSLRYSMQRTSVLATLLHYTESKTYFPPQKFITHHPLFHPELIVYIAHMANMNFLTASCHKKVQLDILNLICHFVPLLVFCK